MTTLLDSPAAPSTPQHQGAVVQLVDGSRQCLEKLGLEALHELQWEQETAFATLIAASQKGTAERTRVIRHGYETVCTILDCISAREHHSESLAMGMDARYSTMVLEVLEDLQQHRIEGGLFELGFGTGILLQAAAEAGYRVGGLEVAEQLHTAAAGKLPREYADNLLLGDFLATDLSAQRESFSLVYWNDVFEHIPVDEVADYLQRIRDLLVPGGALITITPNWHMRPMDVTASHRPPRSTAVGFHLKEYKLSEVTGLLRAAGFSSVTTPRFVGKRRISWRSHFDLTGLKSTIEPLLEWLPYPVAVQCCRRFGFCCTLAQK